MNYKVNRICKFCVAGTKHAYEGAVCTMARRLFVVLRPLCRGDVDIFVKCLQVPREALEIAGTSINFRSGEFGYSICPFFSKGHAEIFKNFGTTFAEKRDICVCVCACACCGLT